MDVALVLPGIVLILPLVGFLTLSLWASQGLPVVFRQVRIGKDGHPFTLLKFRTMIEGAEEAGTVTASADPRITAIGRIVRKFKLDEFPQLLNVLRGDMALVGPRPEVAEYVARLGPDLKTVLSVRPGITAPSSIKFRNEGDLLRTAVDPIVLNDEYIYPLKTRLNVWYVENLSLRLDLWCLVGTALPSLLTRRLTELEEGWRRAR